MESSGEFPMEEKGMSSGQRIHMRVAQLEAAAMAARTFAVIQYSKVLVLPHARLNSAYFLSGRRGMSHWRWIAFCDQYAYTIVLSSLWLASIRLRALLPREMRIPSKIQVNERPPLMSKLWNKSTDTTYHRQHLHTGR